MNKIERMQAKLESKSTLNKYHIECSIKGLKCAQEFLKHPATFEQMKAQTDMILGKDKVDG